MHLAVDRALAALLALTALAYLNGLAGPFQFDDYAVVATDPAAQGWGAWWDTLAHRIRPLLKASFVFTHQLGGWLGHETLGHHLGNLFIHLGVVAASWRLARIVAASFGMPGEVARRVALGTAAVVALHPLATESVTYITGRSVALGTLFALIASIAQMQAQRKAAAAAFVAALLCRETMLVLPAMLALLEWSRVARLRPALQRTAGLWCVAAIAFVALLAHRRYGPLLELSSIIAQGRLESPSMLLALEYFATRFVLLAPLSIDPSLQPEHMSGVHRAIASAAVAALLAAAWRCRSTRPWWMLAMGWVALSLVPMYLVPVRHDGVAERHFYPALWGAALALSCEIAGALDRRVVLVAACATAIGLSVATVLRNADYASEVALWEATSRDALSSPRAFNNLGVAYLAERRWGEAQAAFERALAIDAGHAKARANRERAVAGRLTGDPFSDPEI
jgi:protein O-mannosyl-transferase